MVSKYFVLEPLCSQLCLSGGDARSFVSVLTNVTFGNLLKWIPVKLYKNTDEWEKAGGLLPSSGTQNKLIKKYAYVLTYFYLLLETQA